MGLGDHKLGHTNSPHGKLGKKTFGLRFSKTKGWKTILMTWIFSLSPKELKTTQFGKIMKVGGGGMRACSGPPTKF